MDDRPLIKTRLADLPAALARHQRWLDRMDPPTPPIAPPIEPPRKYFRMAKAALRTRTIARLTRVW